MDLNAEDLGLITRVMGHDGLCLRFHVMCIMVP